MSRQAHIVILLVTAIGLALAALAIRGTVGWLLCGLAFGLIVAAVLKMERAS